MENLNYCLNCKRVFKSNDKCEFCDSYSIKPLKKGTSVNIIGTKMKGQILNCKNSIVNVIVKTEGNEKVVKDFKIKDLKKIL